MGRRLVLLGSVIWIVASVGIGAAFAIADPAPAAVELIDVKFDRHYGTATILSHVSGPGTLTLSGGQVVGRSVETSGAGIAKLKVASKGGALKRLIKTGAVDVRVTVEFAAAEGARSSVVREITLRRH